MLQNCKQHVAAVRHKLYQLQLERYEPCSYYLAKLGSGGYLETHPAYQKRAKPRQ